MMVDVEVTYGFVKPHAYPHMEEIRDMITGNGLEIAAEKDSVNFSREQAEALYRDTNPKWRDDAISVALEGPTAHHVITGRNAIERMDTLVGHVLPWEAKTGTIRQRFAEDREHTAYHRADSPQAVAREVDMFFDREELPPLARNRLEAYRRLAESS